MANQSFDAIVVGSGISSGWTAKELTEKGLKVLLLERGAISSTLPVTQASCSKIP